MKQQRPSKNKEWRPESPAEQAGSPQQPSQQSSFNRYKLNPQLRMINPSPRISFTEKLGYAVGDAATNFFFQAMMLYQNRFYTDTVGLSSRFESIEAWYPNTLWNPNPSRIVMIGDHEGYQGRTRPRRSGAATTRPASRRARRSCLSATRLQWWSYGRYTPVRSSPSECGMCASMSGPRSPALPRRSPRSQSSRNASENRSPSRFPAGSRPAPSCTRLGPSVALKSGSRPGRRSGSD